MGLILLTVAVYWQVSEYSFVNYDDHEYAYENVRVKQGLTPGNITWAVMTFHFANWHPLTWMSHMLDVSLFGLDPGRHHLVNLFFHVVNSVLLFLLLYRMTNQFWKSLFVMSLFALHPINIESVAWISERKNVLSTLFMLLTIWSYLYYTRQPGFPRYLTVFVLFAMGLMAKPMLVTLPFALMLLDYWPLKRLGFKGPTSEAHPWGACSPIQCVSEKLPLIILAAGSSAITVIAQSRWETVRVLEEISMSDRVSNALVAYIRYLGKAFWPTDLAVFYPLPDTIPVWQPIAAGSFIALILAAAIWVRHRYPWFLVGWLWFLGTLVPVIGIVQVGSQAMANRYAYVSFIGLFVIIAWGAGAIFKPLGRKAIVGIFAGLGVAACAYGTWQALRHWENSVLLFTHAIEVSDSHPIFHTNLAKALSDSGKKDEAIEHYKAAIALDPGLMVPRYSLAVLMSERGQTSEAIRELRSCLAQAARDGRPGSIPTVDILNIRFSLGTLLIMDGHIDEAVDQFESILSIERQSVPENILIDTRNNLGAVRLHQARPREAISHFEAVLRIDVSNPEALNNLGLARLQLGRLDEARDYFRMAVSNEPDYSEARQNAELLEARIQELDSQIGRMSHHLKLNPEHPALLYDMARLYRMRGNYEQSVYYFEQLLAMDPRNLPVLEQLAVVYDAQGNDDMVLNMLDRIVKLEPDRADVYYNLACLYSRQNRVAEAITSLETAIEKGYENWGQIRSDSDLVNIRNTDGYKEIIRQADSP